MSDQERQVITAIVDEDQLSLAIGRNGQNVRLASQLIGWQIDLYGSREWLELGADLSLFKREAEDDAFETSSWYSSGRRTSSCENSKWMFFLTWSMGGPDAYPGVGLWIPGERFGERIPSLASAAGG